MSGSQRSSASAPEGSPALLVRLHPSGPWRIGPDSGDRDRVERIFHSDSLYSAVCGALQQLGAMHEWLDATARTSLNDENAAARGSLINEGAEPAVRFSSCFPFHQNTLYVIPPKHLWPPPESSKVRWKGASFVPMRVVEALLSGKPVEEEGWVIDNECLIPSGAGMGLFRASVRSSAAVDRTGEGVAPHSVACLEFTPGSGLWFIAAFASEGARAAWQDRLKAAIRLLADSGLGGERSRGWGRSEAPEFIEGHLPGLILKHKLNGAPNGYWMLSLFSPGGFDRVDWASGDYRQITRRGRVESRSAWGDLKKPARMVAEGSVIVASQEPKGAAIDVAPDNFSHPVYRAGFALAIPVPLHPHKPPEPPKPAASIIVDRGAAETETEAALAGSATEEPTGSVDEPPTPGAGTQAAPSEGPADVSNIEQTQENAASLPAYGEPSTSRGSGWDLDFAEDEGESSRDEKQDSGSTEEDAQ